MKLADKIGEVCEPLSLLLQFPQRLSHYTYIPFLFNLRDQLALALQFQDRRIQSVPNVVDVVQ
jgi:hypothetical protein